MGQHLHLRPLPKAGYIITVGENGPSEKFRKRATAERALKTALRKWAKADGSVEVSSYDGDGKLAHHCKYILDAAGKVVKVEAMKTAPAPARKRGTRVTVHGQKARTLVMPRRKPKTATATAAKSKTATAAKPKTTTTTTTAAKSKPAGKKGGMNSGLKAYHAFIKAEKAKGKTHEEAVAAWGAKAGAKTESKPKRTRKPKGESKPKTTATTSKTTAKTEPKPKPKPKPKRTRKPKGEAATSAFPSPTATAAAASRSKKRGKKRGKSTRKASVGRRKSPASKRRKSSASRRRR